MKYFLRIFFTLYILFAFVQKSKTPVMPNSLADSPFSNGQKAGLMDNLEINEASGLVMSRNNPNGIWTHNDSGDEPRVFLISNKGKHWATFRITGANNRDWEDIAIANDKGINYLYVGDIGDNAAVSDIKIIYRFPEPTINSTTTPTVGNINVENVQKISFRYPDGNRDAECLMVDPITKDIIVVSKREDNVGIYFAPYPQSFTEVITLTKVGTLPFGDVVAGDISPDGKELLLKNYKKVFYWKKADNETIVELMQKPFQNLPYKRETQGESIAWNIDGSSYFTLSENPDNKPNYLLYYQRK